MADERMNSPEQSGRSRRNRLIHEKSPYLLQHAHNPVDWYPWGEEAFAKARRENKPVFLSVGYSTCHWCHVMNRESFAGEEIAAVLNEHFVPVKLDREERPDVDRVYMAYVQAATGGGGWPMSVWLTPDLKPFMGGTYYPPEDRWGRPGFKSVLLRIAEAWTADRGRIVASAEAAIGHLRQATSTARHPSPGLDPRLPDRTYEQIRASYDSRHGGFGGAPKFPRPSAPDFLLRYHARTSRESPGRAGDRAALDMCLHTLRAMAGGGMYDQLGGGFHRYSVDERWHVPHFEKMLYDQAQLAMTYLDACQITRDPFFARIARETLEYVRRDMTGPQGQFYSAEDADSDIPGRPGERAEGAFYVWEYGEIVRRLGGEAAGIFNDFHGVERSGNVRSDPHREFVGKNILYVARTAGETAARFGTTPGEIRRVLERARARLFDERAGRPRPHRDDKAITAWNGMMISAFARGGQVLDEEGYLASARNAAAFVREKLYDRRRGVLLRRYREGEAAFDGYLEDYACLIRGLLDLYEAAFDTADFEWAIELQDRQDALFLDAEAGGYFATTGADASVLLRMKDDYDGAEPSGNSIALLNLLRLARMTDNPRYRDAAGKTLAAFAPLLARAPHAMPQMAAAFQHHLDRPKQVFIAGDPGAPETRRLLREVHHRFLPNKILMLADGADGQRALARHSAFLSSLRPIDGKATAYVCEDHVCRLPTSDPAVLARLLRDG